VLLDELITPAASARRCKLYAIANISFRIIIASFPWLHVQAGYENIVGLKGGFYSWFAYVQAPYSLCLVSDASMQNIVHAGRPFAADLPGQGLPSPMLQGVRQQAGQAVLWRVC
jgi:hypothetical protein